MRKHGFPQDTGETVRPAKSWLSTKFGRMAYQALLRSLVVLVAIEGTVALALTTGQKAQAADPAPSIVINELQWMGTSVSAADEWVELYNPSSTTAVDIGGWILTGVGGGGADLILPKGPAFTMAPQSYFLISRFLETSPTSALNVAPNYQTPLLSIPDTCPLGGFGLLDDDEVKVDLLPCSSSSWPGGSDTTNVKAGLERTWPLAVPATYQTAEGAINLDPSTLPHTFATPQFANNAPRGGEVRDGSGADVDWSVSTSEIAANWSGFTAAQPGLSPNYLVGLGSQPGQDDVRAFASVAGTSTTFTSLGLVENQTYYTSVMAQTATGVTGRPVTSDGFTINTAVPKPPTDLVVVDAPSDNGGALLAVWQPSSSVDGIAYQLNYRKADAVGTGVWTPVIVGSVTSYTLTGLENSPTNYELTVEAIDFSNLHSSVTPIATGKAVDNLVPVVDPAKVLTSQNRPGTNDTVAGAAGASSEGNVTVHLIDRDPAQSNSFTIINSVVAAADGSFPTLSIGDNQYPRVWIQLTDPSDNVGPAVEIGNDVIAPNAPQLTRLNAHCLTRCHVNLDWQDQGPDTRTYQVAYQKADLETRTIDLTQTAITLDLPSGDGYTFSVYAFDAAGNMSSRSNVFFVQLTCGVETLVQLINGQAVTTTKAISGSKSVVTNSKKSLAGTLAPAAQAQEPAVTATPTDTATPTTPLSENDSDWTRILTAVLILLIVAGSFYALSRNFRDSSSSGGGGGGSSGGDSSGAAAGAATAGQASSNQNKKSGRRGRRRR